MTVRAPVAGILAFVLAAGSGLASEGDIRAAVARIKPGTRIDVQAMDGSKTRGYIAVTNDTEVQVRGDDGAVRTFRYDQIKRVRPATHTSRFAWIAVGVISAGIAIVVAVVLIERHNE
ncbi:MAG TPA: hypothetical protein VFA04_07890 [Bryobacteraceae bacterium]|nr:hypothetical protein [Bryobacteraceae bacterium]